MTGNSNNPFNNVIPLFDLYHSKLRDNAPDSYPSLWVHEVSKRLKQLSFLCDRIAAYEKKILKLSMTVTFTNIRDERFSEYANLLFEAEIFVESFYFVAFRVRETLIRRHSGAYLFPDLKGFEATGVRDVRNHLLEHPEKHGGVLPQCFGLGGHEGPKLKSALRDGDTPDSFDGGLWKNADEFSRNLEELLREALER